MKMKKLLLGAFLIPALLLASCGGSNNTNSSFIPDSLGGGGVAESATEMTNEASDYKYSDITVIETEQKETSNSDSTKIDLSSLTAGDYTGYSVSKKNKLSITAGGVYELSGTLNGCVSVDAIADDVRIILNNVTITVPDTNASAAIVFKGSDTETVGDRVLTVYEGSVNTLSDSVFDLEENDGDLAIIACKKTTSLTINGSGKLNLVSNGSNTTGIKLKEKLLVYGANINVDVTNNGIKANKTLSIIDSNIKVIAGNDGIKTDMEPETAEEAALYSSSMEYGYLYINNSSIDIESVDDGIVANNCLYIDNDSDDLIKITTNGGAPNTVTEKSSDSASGKGIKVSGITLALNDVETDYKASYSENYALVINGGNYSINSNSDAISSKGNTLITDGTFDITSGDDGIHSEYLTKITGGNITINNSYEGIEGANVEITGGTINLKSVDDGINAANGDLTNYSFSIYISGGTINVNADGDGLDSNGTLTINGGNVIVNGPTVGNNAALDSDKGILTNGGNVCALGAQGMVETPGTNSSQYYISVNLSSTQSANTKIQVLDSDKSTVLFETTSLKTFQSAIISLEAFELNKTYYVVVGNTEYEATITSIGTIIGTSQGSFGPGGFNPGGRR